MAAVDLHIYIGGIIVRLQPPWRQSTFIFAFSLLMVVLTVMSAFGLEAINCAIFLGIICLWKVYFRCNLPAAAAAAGGDDQKAILEVSVENEDLETPLMINPAPGSQGNRFDYLDNLKSILTALVVYHHATCSLTGQGWIYNIGLFENDFKPLMQWTLLVNQTYFMCLFFFISGYFSSSSLRKKGRGAFLEDKFKRIGTPLVVFTLALAPLLLLIIFSGMNGRATGYVPMPLQCWYLIWLLLLSIAYCCYYDEARDKEAAREVYPPPFVHCIGVALTACFLINTFLIFVVGTVLSMPISFGSLPFDVAAFFFGTVLEHRKTLTHLQACLQHPRVAFEVKVAKIGAIITVLGSLMGIELGWYLDNGGILNIDALSTENKVITVILWSFFMAGGMVCLCYSAIIISFENLNFMTPWLSVFSQAAYAVYLIHPFVVCTVTYTWVQILAAGGYNLEFTYEGYFPISSAPYPTGLVIVGWVYCNVLSQLITWPLAHYFRQLPVIRNYL